MQATAWSTGDCWSTDKEQLTQIWGMLVGVQVERMPEVGIKAYVIISQVKKKRKKKFKEI